LADEYRRAGAFVVMGGPHVTALPQEALEHCDSVVLGEAESVWPEVIKDFERASLKNIYEGKPLEDFFSPVYHYFLKLKPSFLWQAGLPLSRGCKYHCDFCARPSSWPRYIKIDQVISLVSQIKASNKIGAWWFHVAPIIFSDDNIFSNPDYAKELFRALIPLGIKWDSSSSIDIAFDDEALRLAKQSGCNTLFVGIETIYPKDFSKTNISFIQSSDDCIKAIKKIQSYGIKVIASFIIGLDEYRHKDYFKLIWFMLWLFIKTRIFFISLTILTPFPGTKLFNRLKEEQRIASFDWRKYNLFFNVVYRPKNMPAYGVFSWFILIRIFSLFFCSLGLFYILLLFGFPVFALILLAFLFINKNPKKV
ncbi:MAG TPA: radical SAM protein, partial [Candidatus Omnitrophota bacterium]|nr:radical SAM protein [Candidatus Omnitrophota bacterium]